VVVIGTARKGRGSTPQTTRALLFAREAKVIGQDKLWHFSICAALTIFGAVLVSLPWGTTVAAAWGIGKEAYDLYLGKVKNVPGKYWSWADLVADAVGIAAGIVVVHMQQTPAIVVCCMWAILMMSVLGGGDNE